MSEEQEKPADVAKLVRSLALGDSLKFPSDTMGNISLSTGHNYGFNNVRLSAEVTPPGSSAISPIYIDVPSTSINLNTKGTRIADFHNLGLGLSTPLTSNTKAFVIGYKNSHNDPTLAVGAMVTPLKYQIVNVDSSYGLTAGVAYTKDGNDTDVTPNLNAGKLTVIAGLIASFKHVPTGQNLQVQVLPPLGKEGIGYVGVTSNHRF